MKAEVDKSKEPGKIGNKYQTMGMSIGMCFGVSIGLAFGGWISFLCADYQLGQIS